MALELERMLTAWNVPQLFVGALHDSDGTEDYVKTAGARLAEQVAVFAHEGDQMAREMENIIDSPHKIGAKLSDLMRYADPQTVILSGIRVGVMACILRSEYGDSIGDFADSLPISQDTSREVVQDIFSERSNPYWYIQADEKGTVEQVAMRRIVTTINQMFGNPQDLPDSLFSGGVIIGSVLWWASEHNEQSQPDD